MAITVNPDKEFVAEMKTMIKLNDGYCPCSVLRNPDTKCMCKEFRNMKEGTCHCGLYTKTIEESDKD